MALTYWLQVGLHRDQWTERRGTFWLCSHGKWGLYCFGEIWVSLDVPFSWKHLAYNFPTLQFPEKRMFCSQPWDMEAILPLSERAWKSTGEVWDLQLPLRKVLQMVHGCQVLSWGTFSSSLHLPLVDSSELKPHKSEPANSEDIEQ